MNKDRIKELAVQAGYKDVPTVRWAFYGFDKEQFAALIANEIAHQCDLLLSHNMSSEWSRGTHDCAQYIRDQFGVK